MVPLERVTGIILIVGTGVFFFSVSIPLFSGLTVRVWSAPLPEYLELIADHRKAWLWTNGGILFGVLVTVVGLGALTELLQRAGDSLLAKAGLLLFVVGAMFWVLTLAFRLSVTVWAAETAQTAAPPDLFEPLQRWARVLFFIYMVLAYLSTAAYGSALLYTLLLPNWLGWVMLAAGVFGVISFVAGLPGIFSIPAGVHLAPLLIGSALLR